MLNGLQVLRFVAALSVLVLHAMNGLGGPPYVMRAPMILAEGVTIFFCLSGFLMARLVDREPTGKFIAHRVLRIYPALFAALGITIFLKWLIVGNQTVGNWPEFELLPSLLLYPSGPTKFILGVQWTLVFEIFFYGVVAILTLMPSAFVRRLVVGLWAAAILIANAIAPATLATLYPDFQQIWLSPFNLTFIAGMAAWWLTPHLRERFLPLLLFGLGLLIVGRPITFWSFGHFAFFPASVAGSVCIVLACSTKRAADLSDRVPILIECGNSSYGLYLLHGPIISLFYVVFASPTWPVCLAAIALGFVTSGAFGAAEFRLYRWLSAQFDHRRRQRAFIAAA